MKNILQLQGIIILLCLIVHGRVSAAPPGTPGDARPPSAGKSTPTTYRLQPGDELDLHILALPHQDRNLQVRADGGFYHSVLGEVQAAGRTLAELRVEIARRLSKELQNPAFQLGLVSYAKSEVAVLGEVKNQGKYTFYYGATVLDVLAQAGGLTEKADPEGATLLRQGRSLEIDLKPPGPGSATPYPLQPEDIVYVHPGNRISVAGEVQKPGIYAVSRRAASPIAEALKLAAGSKPSAALNRIKLIRPSLATPLIVDFSGGKADQLATVLLDGDSVFVPERAALVFGATVKPGPLPLPTEQMPLLDVLAAGGFTGEAELSRITVVRAQELRSANPKREEYNVNDFFQDGKGIPPVTIQDGDLVYVPTKDMTPGLFDNPLNLLNLIYLVRVFF